MTSTSVRSYSVCLTLIIILTSCGGGSTPSGSESEIDLKDTVVLEELSADSPVIDEEVIDEEKNIEEEKASTNTVTGRIVKSEDTGQGPLRSLTLETENGESYYFWTMIFEEQSKWESYPEKYRGVELTVTYERRSYLTAGGIEAYSDGSPAKEGQIVGTLIAVHEHGDTPGGMQVATDQDTIFLGGDFDIEMDPATHALVNQRVKVSVSEEVELWMDRNGYEYVNGNPDDDIVEYQMPEHGGEMEEEEPVIEEVEVAVGYREFIHAPDNDFTKSHDDIIVNYLSWDQTKWTAKLSGTTFTIAKDGDFTSSSESEEIKYLTNNGGKWSAKIVNGRFLHAPDGNYNSSHPDDILIYKSWDGSVWTMKLK